MPRRKRRTYPNLTAFFEDSGVSQAEFAARINRSQSWVSKVKNGTLEPSIAEALDISRAAGVPLESLIKRSEAVSEA